MAGTELAKAYVQIVPSAKGIKGSISGVLDGEASSAGTSAGNTVGSSMASTIKTALAAAGIGAAIKATLTEGANVQQSEGGIETLFKSSADKVLANAKMAYKTAGLSANDYMETVTSFSASLLKGLAGDTNKAADIADMALTDMSDNANKMGTSMELIQNAYQGFAKQNYTMLDNLKLGYGGTKTEMQRLLADASKLSGVDYGIENLSDIYEAIHIIQAEMGITGTTSKEAASTFSGSLASMKASVSNVLADLALGKDVTASFKALTQTAFTFVKDNALPMIGNILKGVPDIVVEAVGMIVDSVPDIIGSVEGVIENISTAFFDGGADSIVNYVNGFVEQIPLLIDTLTEMYDTMGTYMQEQLPAYMEKGVQLVSSLANGIVSNLPAIIESFGNLHSTMYGNMLEMLPTMLKQGGELIVNLVNGIISNLPQIATSVGKVAVQFLATLGQNLPSILQAGIELLAKLAAGIIKGVPEMTRQIPVVVKNIITEFTKVDWAQVGKDILAGIANGLKNAGSILIDAAKDAAKSALDSVKSALGIHSPSRVFENEVGKMIDLGLAQGIDKNLGVVTDSMKALSDETIGTINTDFATSVAFSSPVSNDTGSMAIELGEMLNLLSQYLPALSNLKIVLDTGALVGETVTQYDEAFSKLGKKGALA